VAWSGSPIYASSRQPEQPMPRNRTLRTVAGIAVSFIGLVGTIIFLSEMKIISFEMAKLMLVALLGMYVGFGVLIAVYRLIAKLK
jgi:hypothetical protein